jgi:hypothetical protein
VRKHLILYVKVQDLIVQNLAFLLDPILAFLHPILSTADELKAK